jgi:D-alanyl-D-alanine carboxypeptidase
MSENTVRALSRKLALVVLIALLCLCGPMLASCSSSKSFPAATQKKMQAAVQNVMRRSGAPGVVVGVWTPDGTWTYASGKADVRTGRAMTTADMVAIGSNTKTFVATLVLQLAGVRALSLDDKLSKYNTIIPNAAAISIRQLLNHTSGIYDYASDEGFQKTLATNMRKEWTPSEEVSIASKHAPYFAPGQGWRYSNTDYTLLGMIVEKVTGTPLANLINSRIADKLDLKNTYLAEITMVEGPDNERAHGYIDGDNGELQDMINVNPSAYWAAGAVASNVDDMGVYIKALATGELLTPAIQKQRLTFIDTKINLEGLPLSYGLGIAKAGNFLGHNGGVLGYSSSAFYLPGKDATFFACMTKYPDANGNADQVLQDVAKVLYPEEFR